MQVVVKEGESVDIVFTGPLRSGTVIDSQKLLDRGYRTFQQDLVRRLKDRYAGIFDSPKHLGRDNHTRFDVDNYQGETIIPRYLVSRSLSGAALTGVLEEFQLSTRIAAPDIPAFFDIQRVDIYLFDFGYGSVIVQGRLTTTADLDATGLRAAGEKTSSLIPNYNPLFGGALQAMVKAVPAEFVARHENDRPELFWVHRIFKLSASAEKFDKVKSAARNLVYSGRPEEDAREDASLTPHLAVYPGSGNSSLAVSSHLADPAMSLPRLENTISSLNVFYAAIEDCDRALFRLTSRRDEGRVDKVDAHLRALADQLSHVSFVKSVYEDFDNQLDPQSIEIWQALKNCWIMDDLLEALDRKVASAERKYSRGMQMLQNLEARRAGAVVIFFVVIAALAVLFDSLGLLSGGTARGYMVFGLTAFIGLLSAWQFLKIGKRN